MAQTATWLRLSSPANTEHRSDFGMNVDNNNHSSSVAPRPIPAPSELNRWDLGEILNPSSSAPNFPRDRKMSLDFTAKAAQPQHGLYAQSDLDQPFSIPNSENVSASSRSLFPSVLIDFPDRHHGYRRPLKLRALPKLCLERLAFLPSIPHKCILVLIFRPQLRHRFRQPLHSSSFQRLCSVIHRLW